MWKANAASADASLHSEQKYYDMLDGQCWTFKAFPHGGVGWFAQIWEDNTLPGWGIVKNGKPKFVRAPPSASTSRSSPSDSIRFWDGELRQIANRLVEREKDLRPVFRLSEIIGPVSNTFHRIATTIDPVPASLHAEIRGVPRDLVILFDGLELVIRLLPPLDASDPCQPGRRR